jgi:NAD+ synthase
MNWELEIDKMAEWLKNYASQAGAKGYVVGLSGGLDSAVVSCLCVKAVGEENVIAVHLPCSSSSSPQSELDATELANNLGIKYAVVDLKPTFDSIVKTRPWFMGEELPDDIKNLSRSNQIRLGNIKARLRMVKLYEIANYYNYLVAGTSNRSELMIGYTSKYGDGGVDLEPIGDFYKTEVYKMVKYLPRIPVSTIYKNPSAELWVGQTDEMEIGESYELLDLKLKLVERLEELPKTEEQFLSAMSQHMDMRQLLQDPMWKKVYAMMKKAEHKNNMPPKYERTKGE